MSLDPAISPAQCRAARGLLDWSQSRLSEAAAVAPATLSRFEAGISKIYPRTLADIRRALEGAGVGFLPNDGVNRTSAQAAELLGDAITGEQCLAARALLDWPRRTLVERAGVKATALHGFETGVRELPSEKLVAVVEVLRAAGVIFVGAGPREIDGVGVRLAAPRASKACGAVVGRAT